MGITKWKFQDLVKLDHGKNIPIETSLPVCQIEKVIRMHLACLLTVSSANYFLHQNIYLWVSVIVLFCSFSGFLFSTTSDTTSETIDDAKLLFLSWIYSQSEMLMMSTNEIKSRTKSHLQIVIKMLFYYIDTSVSLENIPLVKFIKTTSGTWVVYFP